MQSLSWIIAGLFLPLFPMSMLFNALMQRAGASWLRAIILLVWPLPGLWLLNEIVVVELPDWLILWASFTAVLYGFRAVVVKEINIWAGFIATSAWALVWLSLVAGVSIDRLPMYVMAFSLPIALLLLLVGQIERRYESAYVGIVSGLAQAQPKLAGVIVVTMLAVIGSPLFPGFFVMLSNVTHAIIFHPSIAFVVVFVWLLWSWSSMRLSQELLVGKAQLNRNDDISQLLTVFYIGLLLSLIIAGVYVSEILL